MPESLADTIFLVSGGGRGVTARCVIALAKAHRCRFILLGRTEIDNQLPFASDRRDADLKAEIAVYLRERNEAATPAAIESYFRAVTGRRDITHTIQAVASAGGHADYLAVDVANETALRASLAAADLGDITGIIHGAGVLSDRLIEKKTEQDFDRVYNTKIQGLQAMLNCVEIKNLRYLALFSSISGFYGNRGQADYAIANEILNKFAHAFKRKYPACHTSVFNWGPWDGGMVNPHLKSLLERNGVAIMPLDVGAGIFARTLSEANRDVQLLVNDAPPPIPDRTDAPIPPRRMVRTLREADNPFLADHRIGGHAVLPAACAALWMANSGQNLHPGYRFFSLSDFRVLKGVVFDDGLAHGYLLEIGETAVADKALILSVMISSRTAENRVRYHYSGSVRLVREVPALPRYGGFDLARDRRLDALRPYEDGALFHGPVFRAITKILTLTANKITVECVHRLPESIVLGQFPAIAFDPICGDLLFQCLGIWVHQQDRAAALPLSFTRLDWYRTPPHSMPFYISAEIAEKTAHRVVASVYLHDEAGRIFAQASGAELTISRGLARRLGRELSHA
jgi:NAD(P)-dependent dehydrogenase (short-subunit alcohol dehydrogenase family)